jgi:hypothetical protein
MYKHILSEGGSIEWMALVPLIIFVSFFIGLLLYVTFGNKKFFKEMSEMPFNENMKNSNSNHDV